MKSFLIPKLGPVVAIACAFVLPAVAQTQSALTKTTTTETLPLASSYAVTKRATISLTAVEHAHVLTEMNDFLQAINDINAALAAKDFGMVAAIATKMGPKGGKHDAVGKLVHEKMPQEWFAMARPTHQNFLAIAHEAKTNPTVESVLARVAATTKQCIACHATYKLHVAQ